MLNDKIQSELEKLRNQIVVQNKNILESIIKFFQASILLAINLETVDKKLTPKLILGEESKEKDSSKTLEYIQPILSISLTKRAPTGINDSTVKDLFSNNLISGRPKFDRKYIVKEVDGKEQDYEIKEAMFRTDNELCLTLKTKTVREQFILLPLIERALNIYCKFHMPNIVDVCGIKEITTEIKKDDTDLETAKIRYQLRITETVLIDETYLLKGFEIISHDGLLEGIVTNTGKIDENENWKDNVTEEYVEEF